MIVEKLPIPPEAVAVTSIDMPMLPVAGIDELPTLVGSLAVQHLNEMILHRERGIPENPTALMVEGVWQPGETVSRDIKDGMRPRDYPMKKSCALAESFSGDSVDRNHFCFSL